MNYLRLKKQADFQRLFKRGKRAFSPSITMLYNPSDKTRMGISIGKRHGKSVMRNRIKRLIREAFRAAQGEMKGTYSIVLIPKVCEEYSFHVFERHLRCMIKKENLWIYPFSLFFFRIFHIWKSGSLSRGKRCVCVWFVFIKNTFPSIPASIIPLVRNIPSKASTITACSWEYCLGRGGYCGVTPFPKAVMIPCLKIISKSVGFYKKFYKKAVKH